MREQETFIPHNLNCNIGETQATVMIPAGSQDAQVVDSYVMRICAGCQCWSQEKIADLVEKVRKEALRTCGSDDDEITGVGDGKLKLLEQLLIDGSRYRLEPGLIVVWCTPISKD